MTKETKFYVAEFRDSQEISDALMKTKHYNNLGAHGVFLAVQMAKVLDIHPMQAVNGGINVIQGRVELSAALQSSLIRRAGHSIMKDAKSNGDQCILYGKRGDNGDKMTIIYTMKDATQAGIANGHNWKKYPADMLFARATSRLSKQLFGDVFMNPVYAEGEIQETQPGYKDEPEEEPGTIEVTPEEAPEEMDIPAEELMISLAAIVEEAGIPSTDLLDYLQQSAAKKEVTAQALAERALISQDLFVPNYKKWVDKREEKTA